MYHKHISIYSKFKIYTTLYLTNPSFYFVIGLLKLLKSIRFLAQIHLILIIQKISLGRTNLITQIGTERFTKQVSERIKLPPYKTKTKKSVIIGLV